MSFPGFSFPAQGKILNKIRGHRERRGPPLDRLLRDWVGATRPQQAAGVRRRREQPLGLLMLLLRSLEVVLRLGLRAETRLVEVSLARSQRLVVALLATWVQQGPHWEAQLLTQVHRLPRPPQQLQAFSARTQIVCVFSCSCAICSPTIITY
jgi:hypothetical protein